MIQEKSEIAETIRWSHQELYLLDQTRLPETQVEERQETLEQVWESIRRLKVRGAPAIGVAAAYGLAVGMKSRVDESRAEFLRELRRQADYLNTSRPTAVNLSWAVNRVCRATESSSEKAGQGLYEVVVREAQEIHREDIQLCRSIGEHGLSLITPGAGILTHCNAGRLATAGYGTATAPMYLAQERGIPFRVFSDETRPLLQGSRLTAWELDQAGIDVTVITDNMAAHIMSQGLVDLVIVGTDRVAANGDVANKIGTLGVAIIARHFKIPFYVACPASTVDLAVPSGGAITIEERDQNEVAHFGLRRTAPEGVQIRNPAFDITPAELVTSIITDRGVVRPPYDSNLREVFTG